MVLIVLGLIAIINLLYFLVAFLHISQDDAELVSG